MWTGFEDKATWEPGGPSAHSRPFWPSGLQERARTTLGGGRPREEGVVPAAEGPGGGPWGSSQRTRSHGQGTHRVLRDKHVEVQAVLADSGGRGRPGAWLPAAAPADTGRLTSGGTSEGTSLTSPPGPPAAARGRCPSPQLHRTHVASGRGSWERGRESRVPSTVPDTGLWRVIPRGQGPNPGKCAQDTGRTMDAT